MSDEILKALQSLETRLETKIADRIDGAEMRLGAKIDRVGERVQDLNETVARFMSSFKDHRDWATRNLLRIAGAADVDMADDPPPKVAAR